MSKFEELAQEARAEAKRCSLLARDCRALGRYDDADYWVSQQHGWDDRAVNMDNRASLEREREQRYHGSAERGTHEL